MHILFSLPAWYVALQAAEAAAMANFVTFVNAITAAFYALVP